MLRRAIFAGFAACPCRAGFGFGTKSAFDLCTRRAGLDPARRADTGIFHFRCFAVDGECRAALRAELRPADLIFPVSHPQCALKLDAAGFVHPRNFCAREFSEIAPLCTNSGKRN
jgi:hypothetical protein